MSRKDETAKYCTQGDFLEVLISFIGRKNALILIFFFHKQVTI